MKPNYDQEMMGILAGLKGRPRLLLHACCAPCSTSVTERLLPWVDPMLYYYNPNIMPEAEYERRGRELLRLGDILKVEVILEPYDPEPFLKMAKGLEREPEGGARCPGCFRLRLERAAEKARELGIDWFSTTLTVSPHKNPQVVNGVGLEIAEKTGLSFLPADFKKREGYKRSIEMCREYSIYRQDYCGCSFARRGDGETE